MPWASHCLPKQGLGQNSKAEERSWVGSNAVTDTISAWVMYCLLISKLNLCQNKEDKITDEVAT